jgi:hypothetical protein
MDKLCRPQPGYADWRREYAGLARETRHWLRQAELGVRLAVTADQWWGALEVFPRSLRGILSAVLSAFGSIKFRRTHPASQARERWRRMCICQLQHRMLILRQEEVGSGQFIRGYTRKVDRAAVIGNNGMAI